MSLKIIACNNKNDKKVIIIGAGISGMSAGAYLQMNGYSTQILEMGHSAGGLCASWKKKDYIFDQSLHWLWGTKSTSNFNKIWHELDALKDRKIINYKIYNKYSDENQITFNCYTNADQLKQEMLRIAPEDKELITKLINFHKSLQIIRKNSLKPKEIFTFSDRLKQNFGYFINYFAWKKLIKNYRQFSRYNLADLGNQFKNPFFKKYFSQSGLKEISVVSFLSQLTMMHLQVAGYPIGASHQLTESIKNKYLALGGDIKYQHPVKKIITRNDQAIGVELTNGQKLYADEIISAADGHHTIFEMLEGKYLNQTIKDRYEKRKTFPSLIQIYLGVNYNFPDIEPMNSMTIPIHSIQYEENQAPIKKLSVRICNFDPILAPKGKSVIQVLIPTENFNYWVDLEKNNPAKYNQEKERIQKEVIEALDKHFGHVKQHLEVSDIATPVTLQRYTNNWKGSFEGWLPTKDINLKEFKRVETLPNLKNFFHIGQWAGVGGGLPSAALSGRSVAQIICKKDQKKFTSK